MTRAEAIARIDAALDAQWWRFVESMQAAVSRGELETETALDAVLAAAEENTDLRRGLIDRLPDIGRALRDGS